MSDPAAARDSYRLSRPLRTAALITACAALLLSVAVVNQTPFVYWDTAFHFALGKLLAAPNPLDVIGVLQNNPSLGTLTTMQSTELLTKAASHLGARSIPYTLVMYAAAEYGSLWVAAALQCVLLAAALVASFRLVFGELLTPARVLLLTALLTVLTPVAITSSLLIPDFFTGILLLLIALLFSTWPTLNVGARLIVVASLVGTIMMHLSHLPIVFVAGGATAFVTWRCRPWVLALQPSLTLATAALIALVGGSLAGRWADHRLGQRLEKPPFLMGRVISDGPGMHLLEAECSSGSTFALCPYVARLQASKDHNGNRMMWATTASEGGIYQITSLKERAALRHDDLNFAIAAIRREPFAQLRASVENAARMLVRFRMDGEISEFSFELAQYSRAVNWIGTNELVARLPNRERCARSPKTWCGRLRIGKLAWLHYIVVGASGLVLILVLGQAFIAAMRSRRSLEQTEIFALSIGVGIASNAVVCGVLSGPYDRYQSRVIWLLPATAIAFVLTRGWRKTPIVREDRRCN